MKSMINTKNYKNSFFFFVDYINETETTMFKIDKFFIDSSFLSPNKYFSVFYNEKIDFTFLEKNEKLISFFLIFNKFFFKHQIKNLKFCLHNENLFKSLNKKLNLTFYSNFYFFFRYFYSFIFILKKISSNKKEKNNF